AVTLIDDLARPGFWDVVLFGVKIYDLSAAADRARRLLHDDTVVVPLQNGVEAASLLVAHLPKRHVCGGVAYISAGIEQPGVVRHNGAQPRLLFGELSGETSWRLDAFEAACTAAGIDGRQTQAIDVELWRKFVFLAPF